MKFHLLVYLGFLQPTTIVCIHHLPLGEDIQARDAGLAVAVAGAASAAKGELDLRARCTGVDIEDARRNVAHGLLHAVDVLRIDSAGKPIFRVVVYRDGFLKRLYFDH